MTGQSQCGQRVSLKNPDLDCPGRNWRHIAGMTQPVATIIAAALLAVAGMCLFRFEFHGSGTGNGQRFDRWTGHAVICRYNESAKGLVCGE